MSTSWSVTSMRLPHFMKILEQAVPPLCNSNWNNLAARTEKRSEQSSRCSSAPGDSSIVCSDSRVFYRVGRPGSPAESPHLLRRSRAKQRSDGQRELKRNFPSLRGVVPSPSSAERESQCRVRIEDPLPLIGSVLDKEQARNRSGDRLPPKKTSPPRDPARDDRFRIGVRGFEPPASSTQSWRSAKLSYTPRRCVERARSIPQRIFRARLLFRHS